MLSSMRHKRDWKSPATRCDTDFNIWRGGPPERRTNRPTWQVPGCQAAQSTHGRILVLKQCNLCRERQWYYAHARPRRQFVIYFYATSSHWRFSSSHACTRAYRTRTFNVHCRRLLFFQRAVALCCKLTAYQMYKIKPGETRVYIGQKKRSRLSV